MKWTSTTESARVTSLATRMAFLFMAASAGVIGVAAISLRHASDRPDTLLIPVLAVLAAIGLIAVCSLIVTVSITRPLGEIIEFTAAISAGRLEGRLDVAGPGETVVLAAALNNMAEALRARAARISSVTDVLASINGALASDSGQVVDSADRCESRLEQTAMLVETIRHSADRAAEESDRLASTAENASSAIRIAAAGLENITHQADLLGKACGAMDSSINGMSAAGQRIGAGIVDLLDASSETSAAIGQMDASIRLVKKSARDAATISEGVKSDAATGKAAVDESISGMRAIRESSAITAEVVDHLSLRARDIGTILSVIDGLAEQTDLLALNATIIAAQAGEQGKSFAVVADEIRELAERTSSSTREIAAVIRGVQDETQRAVEAINQAEASISAGESLAQHSGAALEKIVLGVEQANIQVNEIARATVEQARGSQCIREAMERVAGLIDRIAVSTGEQTATYDRLIATIARMSSLTSDIGSTAAEQGQSGLLIARATDEIREMAERLREANRSGTGDIAALSRTLADSRQAALASSRKARSGESIVGSLTKQVELLKEELAEGTA